MSMRRNARHISRDVVKLLNDTNSAYDLIRNSDSEDNNDGHGINGENIDEVIGIDTTSAIGKNTIFVKREDLEDDVSDNGDGNADDQNASNHVTNPGITILANDIDDIDSCLMGLENRYTEHAPHRIYNQIYSIGLEIAVNDYSKSDTHKIIMGVIQKYSGAIKSSMQTVSIPEIDDYDKKQILVHLRRGMSDGNSDDYKPIYVCTLRNEKKRTDPTKISGRISDLFEKYDDSANPDDLNRVYDIGVLMGNKSFDQDKMVSKLKRIIDEMSADDVPEISRIKRGQLLTKLNEGFRQSTDAMIRDAYSVSGVYNYTNRQNLRLRARIDGVLNR